MGTIFASIFWHKSIDMKSDKQSNHKNTENSNEQVHFNQENEGTSNKNVNSQNIPGTSPAPKTEKDQSEENSLLKTSEEITISTQEWESLKQEVENWKEKYVRLLADFENYKKRIFKERELLQEQTEERVWKALLPLIDDIERALEVALKSDNIEALRDGLRLLVKKVQDFLKKNEIEPIEAEGQPFDSSLHEAIANQEVENEEQKGKVLQQIQKGYKRKGQVLRFAKVITGK